MAMSDAEKKAIKDLAHDLVDKHLPALIEAELAKLSPAYVAAASLIEGALKPVIISWLDAKIDAI